MSEKLFSSKKSAHRARRENVAAATAAVDKALAERGDIDEAEARLEAKLGKARSLAPVIYASSRVVGSRWQIEHARLDTDYVFQAFPLKPIPYPWSEVVAGFIGVMDQVFPRSVDITYMPPSQKLKIDVTYYTVRVAKIVDTPGWERAIDRALVALHAVNAWG